MTKPNDGSRRRFLQTTAGAAAGVSLASLAASPARAETPVAAADTIVVGVMGCSRNNSGGNGRGSGLARTLAGIEGVRVAYVCDVDSRNIGPAVATVAEVQKTEPKGVGDFRRILEDDSVDAMVIAAPDHWHAPAGILACQAGKHAYVEKPCCHNPQEGQWLVAAARDNKRVVQHGTQRRSWPGIMEAVAKMRDGAIGRLISSKCWYFNNRPSIGKGKQTPPPSWLDWALWQGPAPKAEYRDNVVHYDWHWFWDWGTGEIGNNGVHSLDLARWGMGVEFPTRVVSAGGRYRYDDDQQTPDTNMVTFEFEGDKTITWEGKSWGGNDKLVGDAMVAFYGDKGTLTLNGAGYTIYDAAGREADKGSGASGDKIHLQNFVDAIRGDAKANAEIEIGYRSALLCHLGNIAYRTDGAVEFDPEKQTVVGENARQHWGRDYNPAWRPKV